MDVDVIQKFSAHYNYYYYNSWTLLECGNDDDLLESSAFVVFVDDA